MAKEFSFQVKKSVHGDEYYSPKNVVDMIVPYISGDRYETVWCPFDKEDSLFVQTFLNMGFKVIYGHIDTGQNFFDYLEPEGDIVISNPPFSKRNEIFERLYEMDVPFALVMNFNGLFDSRKRAKLFNENDVQLLIPYGRMKFMYKGGEVLNSPNFQSIYVCHKLLDKQIVFSGDVF